MKYFLIIAGFLFLMTPAYSFESPKVSPFERNRDFPLKIMAGDQPNVAIAVHSVGNVWMTVSNVGQFGTGYLGSSIDPNTGVPAPSCYFPAQSNIEYLYVGAFWIGAIVGRDTLVSIGVDDYYRVVEFWPDAGAAGDIERRSIQPSSPFYSDNAVSEEDIISSYADTLTNTNLVAIDEKDGRPHIPLGIKVTERSYAWSYNYAEDFILFDYSIMNTGRKTLNKVYMGIYVDGDVHHMSKFGPDGYMDDLCGFLRSYPAGIGCDFVDTVNIAYIMDNDGDPPEPSSFSSMSALGAAGVRVVRTPSDSLSYSFNWWATDYDAASDFGPRKAGTPTDAFRDMDGLLGTPTGDRNKYYVMSHPEFDYDELFTAKDHTADGWLPRPASAVNMSDGFDARYLLSFGPFDISPGEILPVSFAWVCGDNVHVNASDFTKYFTPTYPEIFYDKLDFSDLATNSKWASWIYDNPNYDTDGDGYKGKHRICCVDSAISIDSAFTPPETTYTCLRADTTYYEGDGVPDFRGASPPPPPDLRIYPGINNYNSGEMLIRWNGRKSELTRDVFSNRFDFEGFRLYQSLSPRLSDFVLISSFDREDYNRWIWNNSTARWNLADPPFTLDSLKRLYGDNFRPLDHNIDYPLYMAYPGGRDSAFYFTRQDWNKSNLRDTLNIHKRFPDQPYPSTLNLDSARMYYPDELVEDTLFKYFEYEFTIHNLLPSQLYYISVTAFDYGSPGHGLEAMESKPTLNMVAEYAQPSARIAEDKGLDVIVYPNPYRIDGNYRSAQGGGFEGRGQDDLSSDRVRAIHFANLPAKCIIRIFSIDGDLIREINHDSPPDSPQSAHDKWDLITRNTQGVASGIYYYSIESEAGNQLGKIVIIM